MSQIQEHVKTIIKLDIFALAIMDASNRLIFSVSSGKNMLRPGGGKYYKWKYGDVFYHRFGSGSPVVLIHDLDPSFSSYEWNEIADSLSKEHTVYAVDLPGCGRSEKQHITYTNYYYVLFLSAFLKDVVNRPCDIIASGYSSSFCIMASNADSSIIKSVTAVNPRGIRDLIKTPDVRDMAAASLLKLPIIGTTVYNMIQARPNIDYRFTEEYMYNPFRSKERYVDAFYEGAHYNNGKGKYLLASSVGRKLTVNIRKSIACTDARITVLTGEKTDNGKKIARQYKELNPSVTCLEIKGCRQLPHMENPELFLKTLDECI